MPNLPNGNDAANTDRIMLLALWANHLESTGKKIFRAGMGKPTAPIDRKAARTARQYWNLLEEKSEETKPHMRVIRGRSDSGSSDSDSSASSGTESDATAQAIAQAIDAVVKQGASADYGNPYGELKHRENMARAMSEWYKTDIACDNILFTVGGAGGLHNIFAMLEERVPNGLIATPYPHYSLYQGAHNEKRLLPINVMSEPGFRLTGKLLEQTLNKARANPHQRPVSAILLCNPSNPLGTVMTREELEAVAEVLRQEQHSNLLIILDEAYAEMVFNGKPHLSLLTVAPDLRKRIIIMRSATKALSAAGERMSITMAFDDQVMGKLLAQNIQISGHAPTSLQAAYTKAITELTLRKLSVLQEFYLPQIQLTKELLENMGASMPDDDYQPEGAFYVLTDLSDLIGTPLHNEAQKALGRKDLIETDEDITYHLLFKCGVMIAPLSYFGHQPKAGFMRITCSLGPAKIRKMMGQLQDALVEARTTKCETAQQELRDFFKEYGLKTAESTEVAAKDITGTLDKIFEAITTKPENMSNTAIGLKNQLATLEALKSDDNLRTKADKTFQETHSAATNIARVFRGFQARRQVKLLREKHQTDWAAHIASFRNTADKSIADVQPWELKALLREWHNRHTPPPQGKSPGSTTPDEFIYGAGRPPTPCE